MKTFNLSSTQKRTINMELNNPGLDTERLTYLMKFPLGDYEYLKEALNTLISGNLLLRITKDKNNNLNQYYCKPEGELYEIKNMENSSKEEVNSFIEEFTEKPFTQIFNHQLFSFILVKTSDENILLAKIHHSIFDGTSKTIFYHQIKEAIEDLKNGKTIKPNLDDYQRYVVMEKEYLNSKLAERDLNYWLKNLKDYKNEYLNPKDLHYTSYDFPLTEKLTQDLEQLRNIDGVKISPFVIGLAVSALYFNCVCHTSETVWNTTYHGRNFGSDVDNMLGEFINILPMKIEYNPNITFKEYLLQVKNVLKSSLAHGRLCNYQYKQNLKENGVDPDCLANYSIVSNASNANITNLFADYESSYPLHMRVNRFLDDAKGLQLLSIEANNECFSAHQVAEMGENIIRILETVSLDSEKLLKDYSIGYSSHFESKDYYANLLSGFSEATIINPDLTNYEENNTNYTIKSLTIPSENINVFLDNKDLNPNDLFLASTLYILSKFTANNKILINNVSSYNETNFYGDYWRLPIGLEINNEQNTFDYLNNVKSLLNKQVKYSNYPINNLCDCLYEKQLSSNFLYTYNDGKENFNDFYDVPLNLNIINNGESFTINLKFYNKSFSTNLTDNFLNHLLIIIDKFITEYNTKLSELESYGYYMDKFKISSSK